MQNPINSSIAYRADIDGLRAIAIISVIIFHFYSFILPSGFIGVDVFFVISGFLITKIILKENAAHNFSFAKFYVRRIRRIFPALFVMLFFSYIFAFLLFASADMVWFVRSFHYATFQISNLFFQRSAGYFDQNQNDGPLLHTWSLGVEEQFYLLMPLVLFLLFRLKKNKNLSRDLPFYGLFFLSLISLATSEILIFVNQKIAFYSLISRFFELGVGCMIAFGKIKNIPQKTNTALSFIGLGMIALSLFVIKYTYFPGFLALLPCVGAALTIVSGEKGNTLVAKFLSNKIFVFLGQISYSLYLWHLPFIVFYQEYSGHENFSAPESAALLTALLAVSYLSWRFVEMPFRKSKPTDVSKKIPQPFIVALVCIAFFVTLASIAQKTNGLKFRLINSDLLNKPDLDRYAGFSKASICGVVGKKNHPFPTIDKCVIGKNQENFEMALFGDSHAGHYSTPVTNWAQKHDLSAAAFYLFSCPIWLADKAENESVKDRCLDYRQKVWKILQERNHIKYVVLASSWDGSVKLDDESKKQFRENLTQTIQKVLSLNKKLIILGRVPAFDEIEGKKESPLKCIEKTLAPIERILPRQNNNCTDVPLSAFSKQMEFNNLIKETVAKYNNKNVIFLDAFPYFCDDKFCHAIKNGQLLYSDNGHLNSQGASYIENSSFFKLP
jgi:peptidoglycan/LPS O-acetylase OafA/YrhL